MNTEQPIDNIHALESRARIDGDHMHVDFHLEPNMADVLNKNAALRQGWLNDVLRTILTLSYEFCDKNDCDS